MQTWKVKKNQSVRKNTPVWRLRLYAALLLGLTYVVFVYAVPQTWNVPAGFITEKTGLSLPRLAEKSFRLGLDLQGGAHLVYEADMSEIPVDQRDEASEGVRDVIERRVNAFGVSEPLVQTTRSGDNYRVIVELAGVVEIKDAIQEIGETPVLEFKKPGIELERELTAEEEKELAEQQEFDRKSAKELLARARGGEETIGDMIKRVSIDPNKVATNGVISGITRNDKVNGAIVSAIERWGTRIEGIVPEVIETEEGLNIVKVLGVGNTEETQLSHILVCFEGTVGCADPIPPIEASIRINEILNGLTVANFAERSQKYSTDLSTKEKGGDLGWITAGQVSSSLALTVGELKIGSISNVIETEEGFHILYKRNVRTVKTYNIQRVLTRLADIADIVLDVSLWTNTELSGKHLTRATVNFEPQTGVPYVSLQFNKDGGDLFAKLTEDHVGKPIAIFLDGLPISTPVVQQAIYGGEAIITGNFSLEEAKLLAQRLNAGALPVPVNLLSQETVGPTLGAVSLQKSVRSIFYGFALIALYMIIVYRLPGLIACLALLMYGGLNLTAYRLFDVTLTLSGIAGFVLSMGMAVDANVLILERFREEFRSGRDLRSALEEGFKRAWVAIRDGNATTLIAAVVLFLFSSSFIKGFAVTLSIGILLSMLTAVVVSRSYIRGLISFKKLQNSGLYSVRKTRKEESV